jgi:hypothetical protein
MIARWSICVEKGKEKSFQRDQSRGLFSWIKNMTENSVSIELLFNIHRQLLINMHVSNGNYVLEIGKLLTYQNVCPFLTMCTIHS